MHVWFDGSSEAAPKYRMEVLGGLDATYVLPVSQAGAQAARGALEWAGGRVGGAKAYVFTISPYLIPDI